jgi:hypothetical protein
MLIKQTIVEKKLILIKRDRNKNILIYLILSILLFRDS